MPTEQEDRRVHEHKTGGADQEYRGPSIHTRRRSHYTFALGCQRLSLDLIVMTRVHRLDNLESFSDLGRYRDL